MKIEGAHDHIAAKLGIEAEDFDHAPFAQEGGLGKVYQLFGDELNGIMEELNEALAAYPEIAMNSLMVKLLL